MLLLLLMVLPVVIFAWSVRLQASWPVKRSVVILGVTYGLLGLALAALFARLQERAGLGARSVGLSIVSNMTQARQASSTIDRENKQQVAPVQTAPGSLSYAEEAAPPRPAAHEVQPTLESPVVLLVDDDPLTLRLLDATLRAAGLQTLMAFNGKAALSILSATRVHLVLLDLAMPEMDGFELIRLVRQDSTLKHLPLFVLTSRYLSRDEITLLTRETRALFQKGRFRAVDLVAAIKGAIREPRAALKVV